MKCLPLSVIVAAGLLVGCTDEPSVQMTGKAAALAQFIAAEHDHVTVAELAHWIVKDQRDYELLDIRGAAEFDAGHIDGARNVPLAALMSDASLAALPQGRKVVVYSNGSAHAAQAALLLRLVDRDAYALLGGFNYWRAYLNDPQSAGVAEMDAAQRARYQAVACFFEGDYLASAGLLPKAAALPVARGEDAAGGGTDALGLGLGLGLGSDSVREAGQDEDSGAAQPAPADPLGLGLGLGLGGEAAQSLQSGEPSKPKSSTRKLLIKAEC